MNLLNREYFQRKILAWFKVYGRKDLPWQHNITPYRVWISEIMLQQTQVKTVIPYFERFMVRFPELNSLAEASLDEVLQHWSGLGYYARARNCHKTAGIIKDLYQGNFPQHFEDIASLPGIGRSTAGAILSLAWQKPYPILDGNVKRVLMRFTGVLENPSDPRVLANLWELSTHYTPEKKTAFYNQAMMDLGATVCTRTKPNCKICPLVSSCYAHQHQLTECIPAASSIKSRPVKRAYFLMPCYRDQVLLEKRVSKGIWGGLWSFPEVPLGENWTDFVKDFLKLQVKTTNIWPEFKHVFTHFDLKITPIKIEVRKPISIKSDSSRFGWHKLAVAEEIGLPAPTKKLMLKLV